MKTAVVCWCFFSIAFALPIPYQNPPHANAVKESNIKQVQNSHSSAVSYDDAMIQKDPASAIAPGTASPIQDSASAVAPGTASPIQLFNRDTKLKPEAWDSELGSKNADLDSDLENRLEELPAPLYDDEKSRDFLLDMSDEDNRGYEDFHSSEVNHDAEAYEHSSEVNHDAKADENSLVLSARKGIAGWQSDDLFDDNYAAYNPQITDEFLDDAPQNYPINMAKDAEDRSVETE